MNLQNLKVQCCEYISSLGFLNNIIFSLAPLIARIQYRICTTYKICANWLLLVRLVVDSHLFVVKVINVHITESLWSTPEANTPLLMNYTSTLKNVFLKLQLDFWLFDGLVPLTPVLFKGQLYRVSVFSMVLDYRGRELS